MNASSEKMLAAVVKNLPQSLLLTGDIGVGLGEISKYIASLLGVTPTIILPEKDEKIDLEKGIISVDIMRRLYDDTRTKMTSKRIIVIDYAERMTGQAQNAFLKLLEEPNEGIYFILVSHSTSKLLPTVLSRTERLHMRPISRRQSEELLDKLSVTDNTKRAQLLFMAEGLPAELTRLVFSEEYFSSRGLIIRNARELLTSNTYQKLLLAQNYKDDRSKTLLLLLDASKILKKSISDNPQIDTIKRIEKILQAYERIEANGNIRLCLARMVI